jgi:hypothetical protein
LSTARAVAIAEFLRTNARVRGLRLYGSQLTPASGAVIGRALAVNTELEALLIDDADEVDFSGYRALLQAMTGNTTLVRLESAAEALSGRARRRVQALVPPGRPCVLQSSTISMTPCMHDHNALQGSHPCHESEFVLYDGVPGLWLGDDNRLCARIEDDFCHDRDRLERARMAGVKSALYSELL